MVIKDVGVLMVAHSYPYQYRNNTTGFPNQIKDRTFQVVFELSKDQKRAKRKSPNFYRNPVIMAQEWQNVLNRENYMPADLVRTLGVSRARVTQVLRLLRLKPEVQQQVVALGDSLPAPIITERMLRSVVALNSDEQQQWLAAFLEKREQFLAVIEPFGTTIANLNK